MTFGTLVVLKVLTSFAFVLVSRGYTASQMPFAQVYIGFFPYFKISFSVKFFKSKAYVFVRRAFGYGKYFGGKPQSTTRIDYVIGYVYHSVLYVSFHFKPVLKLSVYIYY